MKVLIYLLSPIQLIGIGYALYLIRSADLAMDKSGIGEIDLWREYNSEAGVAISIVAAMWVVTTLCILINKNHQQFMGKTLISAAPLSFFIGWTALWYI